MFNSERSKAKNSITKNAAKFKSEVAMPLPEFVNVVEKSAKQIFKSKMKSLKDEKWKNKALHGQYTKILEKPHVD